MYIMNNQQNTYIYIYCPDCADPRNSIRETVVMQALYKAIDRLGSIEDLNQIIKQSPARTNTLADNIADQEERLETIAQQRQRLTLAFTMDTLDADEYQQMMSDLKKKREATESVLQTLRERQKHTETQADKMNRLLEIKKVGRAILDNPTYTAKRKNAWTRRLFRFWIANRTVTRVEYL